MKKKFENNIRESIQAFLEKNCNAIIEAEVQTYKDTPVSTHSARVYIFTTHTMGIADISVSNNTIDELLDHVIKEFKISEYEKIRENEDLMQNYKFLGGSFITGLILFLPSNGLEVNINRLDELPIELREKARTQSISVSDIIKDNRFKDKYRHLVQDVLSVHFVSFYCDRGKLFRIVTHNDEVLDMPLMTQFGYEGDEAKLGKCNLSDLSKLIEVE